MNNEFVDKQADALAVRVGMSESTAVARVRKAYELVFQREPSAVELLDASKFLASYDASLPAADQRARAALRGLMRALFASNEFFYLD
jgi:hypothetical protein